MILEAERLGVLRDVLVIAAALSLQDPRERPVEQRPQADQQHARFTDKTSDFLTWLNLWRYLREQQRELSGSAFRRMCKREYLNYLRVREWQDFESQLRQVCKEMEIQTWARRPRGPTPTASTRPCWPGCSATSGCSRSGTAKDRARGPREYLGARNSRFAIFPGSALKGANPTYLMAGELVETGRLWARQNAAIKPEWAEQIGAHLVKRTFSEPHWSKKRAAVMAYERVTLYGVTLVADRLVQYGRIDQALSREMFIRHALVYGEWSTDARSSTARTCGCSRRPRSSSTAPGVATWSSTSTRCSTSTTRASAPRWSAARTSTPGGSRSGASEPDLLTFDPAMLTHDTVEEVREADYPQAWEAEGLTFPISYVFQPGTPEDGLTIDVPVATLNRVDADDFSWNVPGLREELVTSLLRSLPKNLRVSFVPAPNTAKEFLARVPAGDEPLLDALERYLRSTTGVVVPRETWDWQKVPEHLRPTYRVVDDAGAEQARGKDLEALKAPLQPAFDAALAEVASDVGLSATGQTTWTFGTIDESVVQRRAGHEVRGFPALVDEGTSVGLGVFGSADEADARHRLGVRRLLLLGMRSVDPLAGLDNAAKLGLAGSPYPTVAELVDDMRAAVAGSVVDAHEPARDERAFAALASELDAVVDDRLAVVRSDVLRVLDAWRQTEKRISGRAELLTLAAMQDMRSQVSRLVDRGFVGEAGPDQLRRYPAYLAAVDHRRERLDGQVARDAQLMAQVADVQEAYLHQVAALPAGRPPGAALRRVRWMLEEYRVSLWAQHLGTAYAVSDQRIRKAMADASLDLRP